jgi:iron complex outermembrane receptor protein
MLALALAPSRALGLQDTLAAAIRLEPVTARAPADSASLPPFALSALSAALALEGRPGVGLDEVLPLVPGVNAQNRFNFSLDTRIAVRGFGARSAFGTRGVTILLDGVPQTLPDGQSQLSNIDLDAVQRIEVVRGAAAAYYGNAAGGVISLSSPPLIGARPLLRLRALGGSHGLGRWSLGARAPLAGGGVSVDFTSLTSDGFRNHSAARLRQGAVALELPLRSTLSAALRLRFSDMPRADNPGALTRAEADSAPEQASAGALAFDAGKSVRQWQGSATLRRVTPRSETAMVLFGLRRDLDNPLPTGPSGYVTLDREAAGLRLIGRWKLGGPRAFELLGGLDVQRQNDERRNYDNVSGRAGDTARVAQRDQVTSLGARLALAANPGARTSILAGVRYDRADFSVLDRLLADGDDSGRRTIAAWSGMAALTRQLGAGFSAHASLGTSFETPTTTELADPGAGGLNDSLAPQRALQSQAGLYYQAADFSIGVAVFRTAVRDGLLGYEVQGAPGRFLFRNTGRTRHEGLEIEADWRPAPWLAQRLAVAAGRFGFVAYPTDSGALNGRRLPGAPSRTAHSETRLGPWRGAWAALELYAASRVFTNDSNTAQADAWAVANLRLGARLARGRLRPFGGVNNLFGRRYVGSLTINANPRFGRYYEPAAGRNWYVGVEVRGER